MHAHSHDHPHHHVHDDDHGHAHPHHGHNHGPAEHLYSHVHGASTRERAHAVKVLTESFVEGFRAAADKTSYLRLAQIPFQLDGEDGLALHLVDAAIIANWQIGTASPAFGSRELVYLPFPGSMVTCRETMTFTYVSLTARRDVDLVELIAGRFSEDGTGPS